MEDFIIMQLKKWSAKIYALLFTLSSLLLPSWSLDANSATAQSLPVRPPFSRHNVYIVPPPAPSSILKVSWEVDINFSGSNIEAEWILRATDKISGTTTVVEEYVYDLPCTKQGNVQIMGGKAHFDPATQDHITCDLPSYGDLAQEFFGIQLDPVCDCVEPWVAAKVRVNPMSQSQYPILYLEEVGPEHMEFQIEPRTRNRAALKTHMSRWSRPEWSKKFNIRSTQVLWSGENLMGFIHTLTQRHQLFSNDWIDFWDSKSMASRAGAQSLETYAATASRPGRWHSWAKSVSGRSKKAQNTRMSTEPMTLYIGYNPTSGQYFSGKIWSVGLDPACLGGGGE